MGKSFKLLILFMTIAQGAIVNQSRAQGNFIPMPQQLEWKQGTLDLKNGVFIAADANAKQATALAQKTLANWQVPVRKQQSKKTIIFAIRLLPNPNVTAQDKESYSLKIGADSITLTASTEAGLFYGLQTLSQMEVKDQRLALCVIADQPAFSWRALLIDVGRNYQPLSMIKEQIDVMAQYKLNVLHFHFTEDIAWRLASKQFPGLTDAEHMTRWPGAYYTQEEFAEIIKYCQDRHILFLPEIEMPGHSAAFSRYFKVPMQSKEGINYIKTLLQEFAETFPNLPYLHIGGDEVKITDPNFMPEITAFVEHLGYKTIAWEPGSNLQTQTIRQLWMGGPEAINPEREQVYIDSKHLYINHMDPLETVTTLFFRQIGNQDSGHSKLLGATLCVWPDRKVAKAVDMFYQNAVYPALLTFAERSWRGGGNPKWQANLPAHGSPEFIAFADFEKRLLQHKQQNFSNKPFPYVQQTQLQWELLGPYPNEGKLAQAFAPEVTPLNSAISKSNTIAGGTVILRHWWADVVAGAIAAPIPNSTYYARTKIWSDKDQLSPFWIGFNNLSRSYASDSPEQETWDNRNSCIWVNGMLVNPPQWTQANMTGDLEKPLLDEGYSFRKPTLISLRSGWNDVLIKVPVGEFNTTNWQNPVKWMFTFVPYN